METLTRRARRPRLAGPQAPEQVDVQGGSFVTRLAQAWFEGWQKFASVAGGRAQDLVGGNPWHRS